MDISSWIPLATPIATAFVAALIARISQSDLQRSQAEADGRIRRLEAIEKAIAVASKAKSEITADVPIADLTAGLRLILHEFADPKVRSYEILDEWSKFQYCRE